MDTAIATAIATVVGAVVAALAARATAKASMRSSERAAEIASSTARESNRATVEAEAYERAKRIYDGTIDLLQEERAEDRTEIADLKTKRREDRATIAALQRRVDALLDEVRECRALCRRLIQQDTPPPGTPEL